MLHLAFKWTNVCWNDNLGAKRYLICTGKSAKDRFYVQVKKRFFLDWDTKKKSAFKNSSNIRRRLL